MVKCIKPTGQSSAKGKEYSRFSELKAAITSIEMKSIKMHLKSWYTLCLTSFLY